ncbi:MAG: glutamine--fructose-6-phosphate transaminase (isomerizing) [Chloroflexi bacterium AL-W]|nr:glutamine--fructose-6-phosphate transaminase (isomerizing) [Chloroflexi bacterium AL-N1]NOK68555.1 glutamine--fructose-6-phosphate transaminase (isomerizing) [Chloroflexi bacterium AL-N10]NOK76041.1 glutamine--fructose-6-phosphate transaminase (isomerizing) [Chloroflexi bacterium AL-N5]NOK82512.1 glutamine--fructose-6-phosphate transaminase (isomerizing) [Chloroflexi bacterium AL-W]NOK92824.1 glutamine--fructose-6-phosphate transaminase (isomerizing) [Chloroflexi bacterium AL-N15]
MCGIVGYVGPREATDVVVGGLGRLEYRGYDSAGIAILDGAELQLRRSVGKLVNLSTHLRSHPTKGTCGIGHTRWATHGGVTEENAHPHRDARGDLVVIQNGIVENYLELKGRLIERGHTFQSQTDTEVIALLMGDYYAETGSLEQALHHTLRELRGGNAIVAVSRHEPGKLVAARLGNAGGIVIGLGEGELFIASDIPAILDYTQRIMFLEDCEIATLTSSDVQIRQLDGTLVDKPITTIQWDPVSAAKGDYKHFMQKEIFEQPRALTDILRGRVDLEHGAILLDELHLDDDEMWRLGRIYTVACGTAWHAALIGKYMIESLAQVRVDVDYGSEFRYRKPLLGKDTLLLSITQSGETVDTLAAMEEARNQDVRSISIVNAIGSQAARLADGGTLYLHAGPEIGVASTKAFTSMLVAEYLLALRLAAARGTLKPDQVREHIQALVEIPGKVGRILEQTDIYEELATRFQHATNALFLGRQMNYPVALEGALKLKEISYVHAEGYPAGEMKHGPIALIDKELPVICIAMRDAIYEKMLSNVEQVKARGGQVIAIVTEGDERIRALADYTIEVPATLPLLTPVLATIPLQLLAYYVAVRRGADVDQPRNLAKSVTVE